MANAKASQEVRLFVARTLEDWCNCSAVDNGKEQIKITAENRRALLALAKKLRAERL